MLGMLSPSYRGALVTSGLFLYVFMGFVIHYYADLLLYVYRKISFNFFCSNRLIAGYYGGRLYKTLRGTKWKRTAFTTAIFYPVIIFGACFLLNFFIWGKKSSGAVPFSTMVALLTMIFGIALPLVFLGFYFGYRKQVTQLIFTSFNIINNYFYYLSVNFHINYLLFNSILLFSLAIFATG